MLRQGAQRGCRGCVRAPPRHPQLHRCADEARHAYAYAGLFLSHYELYPTLHRGCMPTVVAALFSTWNVETSCPQSVIPQPIQYIISSLDLLLNRATLHCVISLCRARSVVCMSTVATRLSSTQQQSSQCFTAGHACRPGTVRRGRAAHSVAAPADCIHPRHGSPRRQGPRLPLPASPPSALRSTCHAVRPRPLLPCQ